MESIRDEAVRNANLSINLDNLRMKYYDYDSVNEESVSFPSPLIYAFEQNLFRIFSTCTRVSWNTKWTQRPDYVSYEYFGTPVFWNLILLVNQAKSIEDFLNFEEILVPSYSVILQLAREKVPNYIEDISDVNEITSEARYYKKYPLDTAEVDRIHAEEAIEEHEAEPEPDPISPLYAEIEEEITLTQEMIDDQYVIIEYQPTSASSIAFFVEDNPEASKYAYDFILLLDSSSGDWKKISWSDIDCPFGIGLPTILNEAGLTIRIVYVTGGANKPPFDLFFIDGEVYEVGELLT